MPMIVRWSGRIPAGRTTDHISAFQDVMPTVSQSAGAKAPKDIDGISVVPTLLGKGEQKKHAFLHWEFSGYSGQQAVHNHFGY